MIKTISFVTAGLHFNGATIYEKALGGSESAVIYMARELHRLGNEVTVYCRCKDQGIFDGVDYRDISYFMHDDKAQPDVCIVSRYTEFLQYPIDSKMNFLWLHDVYTPKFMEALGICDNAIVLSEYHKSLYKDQNGITSDVPFFQTTNGFDSDIAELNVDYDKKKNDYIYASRPERGLELLLERIWPEVVKNNPEARLHLCGYDNYLPANPEDKAVQDRVSLLVKNAKNIIHHGELAKPQYYKLLQSCAYMLYPTDFPEISCINAIEAQANGCLVITSDQYALKETVKSKTRIKAKYGSDEYVDTFLSLIKHFSHAKWVDEVKAAYGSIQTYGWNVVAYDWNAHIDECFANRFDKYSTFIGAQLVYNSDLVAAYECFKNPKIKEMIESSKKSNIENSMISVMYDEFSCMSPRSQVLIDLVDADPRANITVLDLGCNEGILSLPLLGKFGNNIKKLIAYDGAKNVIDHFSSAWGKKYPQIEFILDNVMNLKTHNIKADVVIVGELLEHIENTVEFLDILMSVADKNTLFYFTVPKGPWENIKDNNDVNHVHHFELNDIHHIFKNTNLMIAKNADMAEGRRGEMCSNWMFWFHASSDKLPTFHKMNYTDKLIKTRPYKKISTCMIVKNEEDNLSRCLKTVEPMSDELFVFDTGSSDSTVEIAKKFGADVHHIPFLEEDGLGNFAAARNKSKSLATGHYIHWIDADEQLINPKQIFKYLLSDNIDYLCVKQKHCLPRDRHAIDINEDAFPSRIFKNDPDIMFEGVVHEMPHSHKNKISLFQDDVYLLHYGNTNPDVLKYKALGRNTPLIKKNLKKYPNRESSYFYVMVDLWSQFATNPSEELFRSALDVYKKVQWSLYKSPTDSLMQNFIGFIYSNGIKVDDIKITKTETGYNWELK